MENKTKAKLKRRGSELYNKYFFNSNNIIEEIIKQYDNKTTINEEICDVVFNCSNLYLTKIYELIKYYPNKLKEIKYIDDKIIDKLYEKYGTTINIMNINIMNINNDNTNTNFKNVRGKICDTARKRAKEKNIEFTISNEDIILVEKCIFLEIPLQYGNNKQNNFSASIDRIDSTKGYIKDNIQIISSLANSMKNSANITELKTFANNILRIYK